MTAEFGIPKRGRGCGEIGVSSQSNAYNFRSFTPIIISTYVSSLPSSLASAGED